jgi:hypothetical protein
MSRRKAEQLGVTDRILAEVGASGVVAGPDNSLQLQPANAVRAAIAKGGVALEDLSVIEVNEAFAAVGLASQRDLGLGNDVFNPNGGAIALGHPIGASGARLALTGRARAAPARRRVGRGGAVRRRRPGRRAAAARPGPVDDGALAARPGRPGPGRAGPGRPAAGRRPADQPGGGREPALREVMALLRRTPAPPGWSASPARRASASPPRPARSWPPTAVAACGSACWRSTPARPSPAARCSATGCACRSTPTDEGVFIRSMASRGHLGGLSWATPQALRC